MCLLELDLEPLCHPWFGQPDMAIIAVFLASHAYIAVGPSWCNLALRDPKFIYYSRTSMLFHNIIRPSNLPRLWSLSSMIESGIGYALLPHILLWNRELLVWIRLDMKCASIGLEYVTLHSILLVLTLPSRSHLLVFRTAVGDISSDKCLNRPSHSLLSSLNCIAQLRAAGRSPVAYAFVSQHPCAQVKVLDINAHELCQCCAQYAVP